MKHTYTIERLQEAVTNSQSIRHVLQMLGIAAKGGNYATLKRRLNECKIDTSHFTGQGHNKGKQILHRMRPISDYLSNLVRINSYRLKNKLLSEKIMQPVCCSCELSTWLDKTIPLELDHIDGNSENNSLNNLRLLCPNCHALTETYRGKNQARAKKA